MSMPTVAPARERRIGRNCAHHLVLIVGRAFGMVVTNISSLTSGCMYGIPSLRDAVAEHFMIEYLLMMMKARAWSRVVIWVPD